MLFQVSSWQAGFLLQITLWTYLNHPDQLSAPTTSADYCTTHLDFTLPSPARPPLRIGVPRSSPAPYSPFPRTHLNTLAEVKGFKRARLSCHMAQLMWCETVKLGHHSLTTLIFIYLLFLIIRKRKEVFYLVFLFIGET